MSQGQPDTAPGTPAAVTAFAARRRRQLVLALVVALVVGLLPFAISDVYTMNILVLTVLFASLSQSWNILGGYCGQISLGHAVYFAIGAYVTVALYVDLGILPWFGMIAAATIATAIALAFGYPCFRLAGHYYTIATIVIAEAALLLFSNWEWTGGTVGLQLPFAPDSWATLQFGRTKLPYFYFALGLAVVTWTISWVIEDTRAGYWWRAVNSDIDAAESLGVNVFRSKMVASGVSAFFTAIGGGIYAFFVSYIDPASVMSFHVSLLIALPAVLGGIGTLWGPALGAAILIPIGELTRSYVGGTGSGANLIVYGVLVMAVSLLRPQGLVSLVQPLARRRQR